MEALGRVINIQSAMDGVYVNLRDAAAVTFVGYLGGAAGDTYTLQEATSAAGAGAQNLATITRYHTNTGNGSDAWTVRTQAAAATVVAAAAATQQQVVFTVGADKLSDGFKFLKVTSTGAGTVTAILHDLEVQRKASNLPAIGV